jgi:hypothetical protein
VDWDEGRVLEGREDLGRAWMEVKMCRQDSGNVENDVAAEEVGTWSRTESLSSLQGHRHVMLRDRVGPESTVLLGSMMHKCLLSVFVHCLLPLHCSRYVRGARSLLSGCYVEGSRQDTGLSDHAQRALLSFQVPSPLSTTSHCLRCVSHTCC